MPSPYPKWTHLKACRELKGWSKTEAAAAAGISRPFYSQLENGVRWPSPEIIRKIAIAFRVPVSLIQPQLDDESICS